MRRIASSLMILILILLFGSTFYCSFKTKQVFEAQLAQLNRDYPGQLQLEAGDYQRGLLLSKVQLSLQLQNEDPLSIDLQLRHFPWGVTIYSRLAAESELARQLAELLPDEELLLVTEVDLSGAVQSRFELPDLQLQQVAGSLAIEGLNFYCNLASGQTSGQAGLQLQRLQWQGEQSNISLSDINFNSQFVEQQGLPLGEAELTIARLDLQNGAQPAVELKDFRYQAVTTLIDNELAAEVELALTDLKLLRETFRAAKLKLMVYGVDLDAVLGIHKSLQQMLTDLPGQDLDPLVLEFQLIGIYSSLFRDGLDVKLETLNLQTEAGSLQGQGALHLQGLSLRGGGGFSFDQLVSEFNLELDSAAFAAIYRLVDNLQHIGHPAANRAVQTEQAEQLAGAFVQKGLLTRRQPDGYRSELLIRNGESLLNGNPFRF